jgi:hypothetical protein
MLKSRWAIGLLLLVTAAAYAPVFFAGFVWDDFPLVVDNPQVQSFSHAREWFVSDLWAGLQGVSFATDGESGFYRPLVIMSFAVDHLLWGGNPIGFHLQSLAWHLLAVVLLYKLFRALFEADVALMGATVYALHPVVSEGVVWIAARNDPMGVALLLGAVLCVLPRKVSAFRSIGAYLLFLSALLSKESSLVGIALLVGLDWARWGGVKGWVRYAALGLGALSCLAMRHLAQIESGDLNLGVGVGLLLESSDQVFSIYARLLIWPFDLSVGRSLEYLREPPGLVLLGLVLGGVFCGWLLRRGRRWAVVGLVFAAGSFVPACVAIAAKGQLGERYLTLPLVGIALALCGVFTTVQRKGWVWVLLVLTGFWGVQKRLPDWQSEVSLWAAAAESDPTPYTWGNLGHMHNRRAVKLRESGKESKGEFEAAMRFFEKSFADPNPYLDNCVILIRAPMRRRQFHRGLKNAQLGALLGCAEHPSQGSSFRGIHGVLLALNGQWELARAHVGLVLGDPAGRGEVLRAATLLEMWPQSDRPRMLQSYCALRPKKPEDADVFDASVLRILQVGGVARLPGFDANGHASLACADPERMF